MKINDKILSVPPYISTSWDQVTSVHLERREEGVILVLGLISGVCEIPFLELGNSAVESIFTIHAKMIEEDEGEEGSAPSQQGYAAKQEKKELAFSFGFSSTPLEHMGTFLQHNADQARADPLPKEVIFKIGRLAKTIGIEDPALLPKPEPHCNCHHCQIARALRSGFEETSAHEASPLHSNDSQEELVSSEDLHFRAWDINQTADRLYCVINPLDAKESYNVYLGDSIGCTCGHKNCEHVKAVLESE